MADSLGPLSGVLVVECTHFIAGPLSGRLLADQGADCIKVEPVEGDRYRFADYCAGDGGDISPDFHLVNRGKRSVALDVKIEAGLEVFRRLLKVADVFISNYRPGVLNSWGCGYEAVRALNPKLIYVAISGYGQTGPYSGIGCFDTAIQALTGLAAFQGSDSVPALVQDAIFDKATALTVKDAVTAALYARDAKGRGGQLIEVSLLEAGQSFFWPHAMKGHTFFDTETGVQIGGHRFRWQVFKGSSEDYREPLCGAPVLQMGQVHEDRQTKHNGNLLERPVYNGGRVTVREPKQAARFAGTPTGDPLPAPSLGEHQEQILAWLGYDKDEVRDLQNRGAFGHARRSAGDSDMRSRL